MLRILTNPHGLMVQGRLSGEWVAELRREIMRTWHVALTLDLSNLEFADDEGALLLRQARAAGCELVGASPFIRDLVQTDG
jgi:hypothetical protein